MSTILDKIVAQTTVDLAKRKQKVSLKDFESFSGFEKDRFDFKKALSNPDQVSIISEVKKASPSKGVIREDFDPLDIALRYEEGGASAISVLTDEPFFQGSLRYLDEISSRVKLPCLRKDFIVDSYQIVEAKAHGADAVLIIVTITDGDQLSELLHATKEAGLQALVECYSEEDFERVDFNLVEVIGVNNRDLNTFEVDVHRGISLLNRSPEHCITVSESGLYTGEDLATIRKAGIDAALIGESFMRKDDPGMAIKNILNDTKLIMEETKHV